MIVEKRANGWNVDGKNRAVSSVAQRFKRIKKCCLDFEEHYLMVTALELTGNPTESDLIQVATASYNGKLDLAVCKKAIYRYFGEDGAYAGCSFLFLNCFYG